MGLEVIDKIVQPRILMVGLGGIGSNLIHLLVPALEKCELNVEIDLMDDDIIESNNLGHQNYSMVDVGKSKASALANRYCHFDSVRVIGKEEPLRTSEQLDGYDVIIVAVDRAQPRELVHQSDRLWLDLRCQGDGWIMIDNKTSSKIANNLPQSETPTSCQIPRALENKNIEFGFAAVAALGAQWVFQTIRILNGLQSEIPKFRLGYLTYGEVEIND